ncbi:MAG: hypothetical protein ACXV8I_08020 [Methylobacter sp.]
MLAISGALMPLETHPHVIAITIFIFALVVMSSVRQTLEPSSHWILVCGILLVALGAWSLNGFDIMKNFYEALHHANIMDGEKFQVAQHATSLWTIILPAVVAAMGANLITSWALSRKPNAVWRRPD